ncbi:hypothetical protein BDA99DRAFT_521499 [Phascolomyces articulosus]|uniref:F-box domain-containing protein n=1 Tax=Phascolomyces articulosus TaxID=60185 RepID=A0AAD5PAE4_9FUNG|nr:hypothetical protein BDA99DRAFT_521499 [Phascolomyces articulosus]
MPNGNASEYIHLLTSHDAWTQFMGENDKAIQQGLFHQVIETSCLAIDTFVHSRLLIVYQSRAMAYGKIGQFEKAMADATIMMALSPRQPQGYLCASELYTMQGKTAQAVSILEKGLLNVSGTTLSIPTENTIVTATTPAETITARELIKTQLRITQEQVERRIDFIKSVPTEIMMQILGCFEDHTSDLLEFLHVSKPWRERILGCSKVWTKIMTKGLKIQQLDQLCNIIPFIHPFIKSILLENNVVYSKVFPIFVEQANKRRLSNLNKLTITSHNTGFDPPLFNALQNMGTHLVKLSLILFDDEDKNMMPYLFIILELCPHIQDLTYGGNGMLTEDEDDLKRSRPCHGLGMAFLRCSYLSHGALELVLRKCWKLRTLYLDAEVVEGGTDICKAIQEHGTELEDFRFNADEDTYHRLPLVEEGQENNDVHHPPSDSIPTTTQGCLYHLQITDEIYWLPTLVPLLSAYCETLVELDMPLRVLPGAEFSHQIRALGQTVFPSMRKLSIRDIQRTHRTVTDIIHQCRMLRNLSLSFANEESARYVLEWMANDMVTLGHIPTPTLEGLEITVCERIYDGGGSLHLLMDHAFVALFHAFHTLGGQSALQTVVFAGLDLSDVSFFTERPTLYFDALSHLASLSTIRCIKIIEVVLSKKLLNHFLCMLGKQGTLTSLHFAHLGRNAIDDTSMAWVGSITSLKDLTLKGLIGITDNCLDSLGNYPNTNRSLDTLSIVACPFITEFGVRYIRHHIPHVVNL